MLCEGCKDCRDTGTVVMVGGLTKCTGVESDIDLENGTKGAGRWSFVAKCRRVACGEQISGEFND